MRAFIAISLFVSMIGLASAQGDVTSKMGAEAGDSPHSTGRTELPKSGDQQQPQGPTGPIHTQSGGAPAASPQGQTPPGMQAAPEGSSKTIVEDKKS
jgi:hypothetical protein